MTDKKIMNPCIECGKNFCGAQIEGKKCEAMFYGKREQEMNRLEELKNVELGEKIGYKKGFEDARKQFERPHGEWLSHYDYCKKHGCIPSGLIAFWWCDQCEQGVELKTNFCPKCGADMQVKNELNRVSKELNSETEKSKSEIVPDYRDGWRLKESGEK